MPRSRDPQLQIDLCEILQLWDIFDIQYMFFSGDNKKVEHDYSREGATK